MRFSPTATLALVLATGMAGAAMAQTTAKPDATPSNPQPAVQNVQAGGQPGQAQPTLAQPPAATGQTQADTGARPNQTQQPAAAQQRAAGDEQVRQAQQQLQYAGFYKGPVDGVMDPDTRAAIARFQQQNGLRRTQNLDQATMARLMATENAGSGTSAATTPAPTPSAGPAMATPPTGAGDNPAGQPMQR